MSPSQANLRRMNVATESSPNTPEVEPVPQVESQAEQVQPPQIAKLDLSAMGIKHDDFIAHDSPVPEGFSELGSYYLVYDHQICAPHGLLQGWFLKIDEWVEGGNSRWAAIFIPTKACLVLEPTGKVQDGRVLMNPRRARRDDVVAVPLFRNPQNLRRFVMPAFVAEMQVRATENDWVFLPSKDQKPRAELGIR